MSHDVYLDTRQGGTVEAQPVGHDQRIFDFAGQRVDQEHRSTVEKQVTTVITEFKQKFKYKSHIKYLKLIIFII